MRRIPFAILSLLLGAAASAAAFSIVRAAGVTAGQGTAHASDAVIAQRAHALDREARALGKAREGHPPKLPRVPRYKPVHVPHIPTVASPTPAPAPVLAAPAASAEKKTQAVIYKRAKPVVQYKRSTPTTTTGSTGTSDDESEHESDEHESGDDGSGFGGARSGWHGDD